MAKSERKANLPVDFFELGEHDEQLTTEELCKLSLFKGLDSISFYKYPGSTVLRKCHRNQVMCRQNEAGASAFYILTTQDVIALRLQQIVFLDKVLNSTATEDENIPPRYLERPRADLQKLKSILEHEIKSLSSQLELLNSSLSETAKDQMLTVAKVNLRVANEKQRPKRRSLLKKVASWFRSHSDKAEVTPAFIHVDSTIPLDGKTLEASLNESDIFGEMSCRNLAPRSATVTVTKDCYMLEFLRNILDMLDKDDAYRAKNDEIYRTRVLDKQVRNLSLFKDLSDLEFSDLRQKLQLVDFEAGSIIFDEHEQSDCLYLVRGGLVKVVKSSSALLSSNDIKRASLSALAEAFLDVASDAPSAPVATSASTANELAQRLTRATQSYETVAAAWAKILTEDRQILSDVGDTFIVAGTVWSKLTDDDRLSSKTGNSTRTYICPQLPQDVQRLLERVDAASVVAGIIWKKSTAEVQQLLAKPSAMMAASKIWGSLPANVKKILKKASDSTSDDGKNWLQLITGIQELQKLNTDLLESSGPASAERAPDSTLQERIVAALNNFIRSDLLITAFGDRKAKILATLNSPQMIEAISDFPEDPKYWSDSRKRVFHRILLEIANPQAMPKREFHRERTLNYLSKGEVLGEMGVLTNQPRSATCLAFDQHDRGQEQSSTDHKANRSRVELVQLKKSDLKELEEKYPNFKKSLEAAKNRRVATMRENRPVHTTRVQSLQSQTSEFEELGLIQGQKLMLIDLEKCTRCNACVEACVHSHEDGRNRLYLDGPRFDKYLVPVTCRSCLDPVCLIGCPVGAIFRGDNGEINIRNHCIGCEICTEQCPYGSIHMSLREEYEPVESQNLVVLEANVSLKEIKQKAVVCDMCSSTPSRSPSCVYACPHDAAIRIDARDFFGVTDT